MSKPNKPYFIVDFPDLENVLPPRNCPGCGADVIRAHAAFNESDAEFDLNPSLWAIKNGHKYETVDHVFEIIADIIKKKPTKGEENGKTTYENYCSATIEYGCTVTKYPPSSRYPTGHERMHGSIYWGSHMDEGGIYFTTSTFESGDYHCSHPSIEIIERILAEMKLKTNR
jgi:hypothetical protein